MLKADDKLTVSTRLIPRQLSTECARTLNIEITKRILFSLREKGPTRMTNLAGRSGINYKRCVKYVNLLRVLGLIEVIYDNGYFVVVTKRGIEISETVGDGLSFR